MSDGGEQSAFGGREGSREQRRKHRSKRKSRKQEKLFRNLAWLVGGLAVGLPMLAATLYVISL